MRLTDAHRVALANEGLTIEVDFIDSKQDALKIALRNMRSGLPGIASIPKAAVEQLDADTNVIVATVAAVPPVSGIRQRLSLRDIYLGS